MISLIFAWTLVLGNRGGQESMIDEFNGGSTNKQKRILRGIFFKKYVWKKKVGTKPKKFYIQRMIWREGVR